MNLSNNKSYSITALLFLFLGVVFEGYAQKPKQEDDKCVITLEGAHDLYRQGRIEEIPNVLSDCIKGNSLGDENKQNAFKLLTLTYLYFNERDTAEMYMRKFLKMNPEYKINESIDPTEFIQLYNTFKTSPVIYVGGKGGGNLQFINVIKNYSLGNITDTSGLGTYKSLIGFQGSISVDVPLSNKLSIAGDATFYYQNFLYNKKQFGYSHLEYKETQLGIEVPLSLRYYYYDSKVFKAYAQLGGAVDYLLKANVKLTREDEISDKSKISVDGPTLALLQQRQQLKFKALGGVGFLWKSPFVRGYVLAEMNYFYGFNNIVKGSERYSNNELLYKYLYIDNDISLNKVMFSVGYYKSIYNPKVIKRKKRKSLK